jgi:hypothetical protein
MTKAEETLYVILFTIFAMSDRVEASGGMASFSGISAANSMQKSIQKNKSRILKLLEEQMKEEKTE